MKIIKPAILVYDEQEFDRQLAFAQTYTNSIDIDIIDWAKVDNHTINTHTALSHDYDFELNFDLMQDYPSISIDKLIDDYRVNNIIINVDNKENLAELISKVKIAQKNVGISINPQNDIENYYHLFPILDIIQIMTVIPGMQGNPFLNERLQLAKLIKEYGFNGLIGVDGGINLQTIKYINEYPIDLISVGSALSKADDPKLNFEKLNNIINN
jgi:ribulose-phosphate 3-epimerase